MTESWTNVVRHGIGHARWLARVKRALDRQPDLFTVNGVDVQLGGWATPDIREAIYRSLYEGRELEVLAATLERDDRYLEVGVGVGVVTAAAAKRIGSERVVGYDANPKIIEVARATATRNDTAPLLLNAALMPESGAVPFYLHDEFWASGLEPLPGVPPIEVPAEARDDALSRHGTTYLMVDIEGGEIGLLAAPLPSAVRKVCVECHPQTTGNGAIVDMLRGLFDQGFVLDVHRSRTPVLYLHR